MSMEFSRQVYWNGLPCPLPGDLPDPGVEPVSPALQADFFFFLPSEPRYYSIRLKMFSLFFVFIFYILFV